MDCTAGVLEGNRARACGSGVFSETLAQLNLMEKQRAKEHHHQCALTGSELFRRVPRTWPNSVFNRFTEIPT